MSLSEDSLEWYFHQAISKLDPAEREQWLRSVLGDDPAKLKLVLELIADYQESDWLEHAPRVVLEARKLIDDLSGKQLGPFLLTKLIGSGGMGDVYLAKQSQPVERVVALKLILRDVEHQLIVQRFQREKQVLATMEHPNIARIIDAGTTDSGFSYIAMEFIDGVDLLEYCKSNRLGIEGRIHLILQCCRAIQHAHQKGIIHRDIKPNNILVTQVDGEPMIKVIDFGIAKAIRGGSIPENDSRPASAVSVMPASLTGLGYSPGTPPYMSPEQFLERTDHVDSRSDIYAIGALLYLLLTEQEPFDKSLLTGVSIQKIGELIRNFDPVLPSLRAPEYASVLRGDLDAIVRKAMHRDIDKRYQSVTQLSEDLRHYLAGETVSCNRGPVYRQIWKFAKRNRLVFSSVSIATAGLLLASVGLFAGWILAVREKRVAVSEARIANLLSASLRVQRQEYREALEGLESTARGIDRVSERIDYRLLRSQIPSSPEVFSNTSSKIYFGLSLPSRQAIACGSQDSTLMVWDWGAGQELWKHGTEQIEINGLAGSPDGKYIASAGEDGTVKIWDLETKSLLRSLRVSQKGVFQVSWSADGRFLITASNEPNAKVWSLPEGRLMGSIDSSGVDLECVTISKTGYFAFGDHKGSVRVGRLDSFQNGGVDGEAIQTIFNKYVACSSLAFSDSGRYLAIGLNSGYFILLRNSPSGYQAFERIRFSSDVTALCFSSNELRLAIGDSIGGVHVLNLKEDESRDSKLHFTERFFEIHSDQLGGKLDAQGRRNRLDELIDSMDPPDAFDSLALATNRIVIQFKEPLLKAVFEEQFARRWIDASQDPGKDQFETPMRIYSKDKTIELIFEDRLNRWAEPAKLHEQRRLKSWASHTKRVSGVSWDGIGANLFSFSEDRSVRKLKFAADSDNLLEANAFDIYPYGSDHLLLLDKDKDRVSSHHYKSVGNQAGSTQIDGSVPNECFHVVQGTLGCFGGKIDASGLPSKRLWGLGRFDPVASRFFEITKIPSAYELVHLIGCPKNNQWLARFSRSEDASLSDPKPAFLGLWDGDEGDFVWKSELNSEPLRFADMSPDGRYLVYEKNSTIYRVHVQSGQEIALVQEPGMSVSYMKFSPDSGLLAVVLNKERLIRCYQNNQSQLLKKWDLREHGGQTVEVAWSKDQSLLISISRDGRLRTYDLDSQRLSAEIVIPLSDPKHLKVSDNEQVVFVLDRSGAVLRVPCPAID